MTESTGPAGLPQQKSGMSRGCLVSLIVVGVIVILVVAAAVVCWVYKEEILKTTTVQTVLAVKDQVATDPPEGADTVRFNAVTDSFVEKFNADTSAIDVMQIQSIMQTVRTIMDDKVVDAEEVEMMETAMFRFYPAIGDEYDLSPAYDTEPSDSLIDTTSY